MHGKCVTSLICAMLLSISLSGLAAEIINLGGLRKVSAKLEQDSNDWKVEVSMIPVRCFTPLTNKKVTRSYAKRYAMTALAVHFHKKTLSATYCRLLSESHTEEQSTIAFQITGVSFRIPQSIRTGQKSSPEAGAGSEMISLSGDLLNRKNDWMNTLTSFFNVTDSDIQSLNHDAAQMKSDELCMKVAELEEDCSKNCKMFKAKIQADSQLLHTEKDELAAVLHERQNAVIKQLQNLVSGGQQSVTDLFSKIKIKDACKPYLLSNKILMEEGGAQLYELPSSQRLLVSVGFTEVRADTAEDRVRRGKAAKINALTNLLKMTGVKVITKSLITDELSVVRELDGKEKVISIEQLFETTAEQAEGKVRALPVIGTWYSKDGTIFYTAIGEFINHE